MHRVVLTALLTVVAIGLPLSSARAAPGDLDLSFSGDGKQTTSLGALTDAANAVVRQPDGKIVAAGVAGSNFAVVRYKPDGSLDTTFSGDGKLTTDFGTASSANALVLQPDGKILAAGGAGGDFALARYNPDGSLDTGFSGDGKLTTGFDVPSTFGSVDVARAVAIQGDKIVAAGFADDGLFLPTSDFALARYNADGSLDTGFSGDGKQTTDFARDDRVNAIALDPDGKIVAAGFAESGDPFDFFSVITRDFALARYNPDGSLDTGFSGDGKLTTDLGALDAANAAALQPDGKIVAAGSAGGDFGLARYNADGSLDTGFSADGKQATDLGTTSDRAMAVAFQTDGRIVAAGFAGSDLGLARYNADGSPDTSLSGDGTLTAGSGFGSGNAVALQPDGKILAAGRPFVALASYNADGSLDTGFSGDGKVRTAFGTGAGASAVELQPDGKILAAGSAGGNFGLARYNTDGSLDTGFSGDGLVITDLGGVDAASGVAVQADGKIVAAGLAGDDFALARYNPDGSLDAGFSDDGKQTTDFGRFDRARAVDLQPDDKVVAAGFAGGNFALARYNPDGSLDTGFSGDGKQTTDFGAIDRASGVVVQPAGKIVAAGGAGGNFALATYNADGSLDTGFSGDGKETTDFGTGSDRANAVASQTGGRVVAAGGAGGNFALATYNADGSLDTGFSGDGKETTDFGTGSDRASAVACQADGRIVAAGFANDFALARYNTDGSLDTGFSGDGILTTDFGAVDAANAVALPAGKIVAAGRSGNSFAVSRYVGAEPGAPFGNVLKLDGVDDYASIPDNATLDLGDADGEDFTIEAFFHVPNESRAATSVMFNKVNAYGLSMVFRTSSPDTVTFRLDPVGTLTTDVNLTVGWHHVAAVFDNNSASSDRAAIYLDGNERFSQGLNVTPGINNSTNALGVGGNFGAAGLEGALEEARFSDSMRYTGSYTVPSAAFSPDGSTRALWHFNETTGSTSFADSSGNSNTLNGQNGAQTGLP